MISRHDPELDPPSVEVHSATSPGCRDAREQLIAAASAGYRRAPVARDYPGDLETPLSVFLKLAHAPHSYLFESVQGGERWGRYSFIGLPARERIEVTGHSVRWLRDGEVVEQVEAVDPLAWIEAFREKLAVAPAPELGRFTGGLVGFFGFDTVRLIEPRLDRQPRHDDVIGLPDIVLMVSEEIVVFDNLSGRLTLIVHAELDAADGIDAALNRAERRLDQLCGRLAAPIPSAAIGARGISRITPTEATGTTPDGQVTMSLDRESFEAIVERARQYIIDGDVMQVVLAQRLSEPFALPALALYRALRALNPSPYLFHVDLGDAQIVGASPEILVRVEDGLVTVRPIAGTRRRGADALEDAALEADLLADPKERAEHLMLIDLGRNDIGRVCAPGSVRLTECMTVERYSHVMHIVSNVEGRLAEGLGPMDVLRATFPAGTVSGAPKLRALEIIHEFEPVARGPYAGAVGYLGWNGNLDTAIAIRTAVVRDGRLHVQAGAGVVYDSVPESEWVETLNKGRAVRRAAEIARSHFAGTPPVRTPINDTDVHAVDAAGQYADERHRDAEPSRSAGALRPSPVIDVRNGQ